MASSSPDTSRIDPDARSTGISACAQFVGRRARRRTSDGGRPARGEGGRGGAASHGRVGDGLASKRPCGRVDGATGAEAAPRDAARRERNNRSYPVEEDAGEQRQFTATGNAHHANGLVGDMPTGEEPPPMAAVT